MMMRSMLMWPTHDLPGRKPAYGCCSIRSTAGANQFRMIVAFILFKTFNIVMPHQFEHF